VSDDDPDSGEFFARRIGAVLGTIATVSSSGIGYYVYDIQTRLGQLSSRVAVIETTTADFESVSESVSKLQVLTDRNRHDLDNPPTATSLATQPKLDALDRRQSELSQRMDRLAGRIERLENRVQAMVQRLRDGSITPGSSGSNDTAGRN
jgi:signal transduction histidine kinase